MQPVTKKPDKKGETTDRRREFWRNPTPDMMIRAAGLKNPDGSKGTADGVVKGGSSLFGAMPY